MPAGVQILDRRVTGKEDYWDHITKDFEYHAGSVFSPLRLMSLKTFPRSVPEAGKNMSLLLFSFDCEGKVLKLYGNNLNG